MARIMVIAGGDWQVDLVKKAKEMGHYVICSNLYEKSPAFEYADACEVADVLDKETNLKIALKYAPDAVITDQSDIAVPTVAHVNEKLGLRGIGKDMANLFTDKSLQRQFCVQNGFPVPENVLCSKPEDAYPLLERAGKIIIKPIDSQSSRGVYTIHSKEDLQAKFSCAMSWSNRRPQVLAEEYIDGDEFTIDGLVVGGKHFPLCVSIKEMYPDNPNVSRMQTYSNFSDKYDYDALRRMNKEFIQTTGLKMGLTHSEYRAHKESFYLIEAGARGGGSNLSSRIVPFMSGIQNYEYLIHEALGEPLDLDALDERVLSPDKYVVMRFFDFGYGTIRAIHGVETLRSHPLMLDWQVNVCPGDVLQRPAYGRQRPGHFIIGGEDREYVEYEAQKLIQTVCVELA